MTSQRKYCKSFYFTHQRLGRAVDLPNFHKAPSLATVLFLGLKLNDALFRHRKD